MLTLIPTDGEGWEAKSPGSSTKKAGKDAQASRPSGPCFPRFHSISHSAGFQKTLIGVLPRCEKEMWVGLNV